MFGIITIFFVAGIEVLYESLLSRTILYRVLRGESFVHQVRKQTRKRICDIMFVDVVTSSALLIGLVKLIRTVLPSEYLQFCVLLVGETCVYNPQVVCQTINKECGVSTDKIAR